MAIPEEDRGPRWLRDYGSTDFGNIAADIAAMEEFAAKLAADVQNNYAPHLSSVSESMRAPLPDARNFPELAGFLTVHREAQSITESNVYNFANGTNDFATAAQDISKTYSGSDAFARAKVSDVDKAFHTIATERNDTSYRENV
jgi:hypothetical protein